MLDSLLMRFHGLIDWLMVFLSVFFLVLACQLMVNFMKTEQREEAGRKESPTADKQSKDAPRDKA